MTEQEKDKEISRLKERERSLMHQLDLARATIAFQAYGVTSKCDCGRSLSMAKCPVCDNDE